MFLPAKLTDSSTGTADGTVAEVADIALDTTNTYTDAAVNTAVNTALTTVNNNMAELTTRVNQLIDVVSELVKK